MKIKRKKHREYQPASDGWHVAVLADVEDRGVQASKYGEKAKLQLVFLTDERDREGSPIRVSDFCTVSLHENSKLTNYVRLLTGADPDMTGNPDEDFDCENLIGRSLRIKTAQHLNAKGQTYANVTAQQALKPGEQSPGIPLNFLRAQDRPRKNYKPKANIHGLDITDRDVQFPGDPN